MSQAISVQDLEDMEEILNEDQRILLEMPLILSTTYPLNYSETKRVTVGLQPRVDGSIQPVVKLQNSASGGIVFGSESWALLQSHLPAISKYFDGNQKVAAGYRIPPPIRIGNSEILFTTTYGFKAVAFDRYRRAGSPEEEAAVEDGPAERKYAKYTPVILMQRVTFRGLLNVLVCVDERFRRLQRNAAQVQMCADVLCTELQLYIPRGTLTGDISNRDVSGWLKLGNKALKEAVRLRLDASFADFTFPIVYLEVSILCTEYIAHELRKTHVAGKKQSQMAQH